MDIDTAFQSDRVLRHPRLSPRLVLRRPRNASLMVRQLLRRTQVIALLERHILPVERLRHMPLLAVP